ncbi:hypothetical protein CDAR_482471 [Caerostris darwini]|uniref:Uncharacterized protein n=1 Tax=Caerostris darwini TaxID=1538125 RepID=A0AAV4V9L4_9ARAC|nr:hypothetical protein CDAR_482471 [Caerostris darwini]
MIVRPHFRNPTGSTFIFKKKTFSSRDSPRQISDPKYSWRCRFINLPDLSGVQEIFGKTGNAEDPEKREPLSPLVRILVTSPTPASPSGRKEGIWGEHAHSRVRGRHSTSVRLSTSDHRLESPTAAWKPGKPLPSTHSDSSDSIFDLELELAYTFAKTI